MTLKPSTVPDLSCQRHHRRAKPNEWLSWFAIAERSLTPIHFRRIAHAPGASGGGRTCLCSRMHKDELDAGPRCATNVLDQAVCMATSKRLGIVS
jgi:hypothetical protein